MLAIRLLFGSRACRIIRSAGEHRRDASPLEAQPGDGLTDDGILLLRPDLPQPLAVCREYGTCGAGTNASTIPLPASGWAEAVRAEHACDVLLRLHRRELRHLLQKLLLQQLPADCRSLSARRLCSKQPLVRAASRGSRGAGGL
jgi:hypothetical protein